jgi:hypothetical protein
MAAASSEGYHAENGALESAAVAAANPLASLNRGSQAGPIPFKADLSDRRRAELERLLTAITTDPDDVESWMALLGFVRHDPDSARPHYEAFLKRFPTSVSPASNPAHVP